MSVQIAVRIPDKMMIDIDGLVDEGDYESRAELVRMAIEELLDADRRRRIGQQIAEGYRRIPPAEDGLDELHGIGLSRLESEPW